MTAPIAPQNDNDRITANLQKMRAGGATGPEMEQYLQSEGLKPQSQAPPQGPMDALSKNMGNILGAALGPLGGGLANTAMGGQFSTSDIIAHGLTQHLDDKAIAGMKAVASTIGRGGSLGDNYSSALQDLVQRREQGMKESGVGGKVLDVAASAAPYLAIGGGTSLLGKLATGTISGAVAGGAQAFGDAPEGQGLPAAASGAAWGGALGLGLSGAGLAAAKAWRAFRGPISAGDAGAKWLRTTGAFDGPIEDYENKMTRQLATRPESSALIVAQTADDKLAKDLAKKVARDPRALAKLEDAADLHHEMAQPYYAKAFEQSVTLSPAQATKLTTVPEMKSAWDGAVAAFGPEGSGKYNLTGGPETIAAAAFKNTRTGEIIGKGIHHGEAYNANPVANDAAEQAGERQMGFLTNRGRFVERPEALDMSQQGRTLPSQQPLQPPAPQPPAPGMQVPVEVMDFIKKRLDFAVNKMLNSPTPNYNETENLKLFRDALMAPVRQQVPDYARATDVASVSQFLRKAVETGKMLKNTAAIKGAPSVLPNPMPEVTVGLFASLLHGNPMAAGGLYGLRTLANMARRATGVSASRDVALGTSLMLEPASTGLPKLAKAWGQPPAPEAGLSAVLGALGGAGAAALVPEESSR